MSYTNDPIYRTEMKKLEGQNALAIREAVKPLDMRILRLEHRLDLMTDILTTLRQEVNELKGKRDASS